MKAIMERLIRQHGTDVTIIGENKRLRGRIFLQLVASKNWQNMERMIPTGGELLRGQFLLIAPTALAVEGGDQIFFEDRVFIVRRIDSVIYRNRQLFRWGLCVEGGGPDPWTV